MQHTVTMYGILAALGFQMTLQAIVNLGENPKETDYLNMSSMIGQFPSYKLTLSHFFFV